LPALEVDQRFARLSSFGEPRDLKVIPVERSSAVRNYVARTRQVSLPYLFLFVATKVPVRRRKFVAAARR
jgi:hypothetical protein